MSPRFGEPPITSPPLTADPFIVSNADADVVGLTLIATAMERLRWHISTESRMTIQETFGPIYTPARDPRVVGARANESHIALLTHNAESAKPEAPARESRFASELKVALERPQR